MTTRLRRAGGYAAVSTFALAAPELGPAAAVPYAAIAVAAAFLIDEGPLFELFARPGDYRDGRLNALAGFALAAAALAVLATVPEVPIPMPAFVASVLVVGYGNLGAAWVRGTTDNEFLVSAGYTAAAFAAALLGQAGVALVSGTPLAYPLFAFLAGVAALVAGLLRSVLFARDDPVVMVSVGLALWLFAVLEPMVAPVDVGLALGVTLLLGYVSYATGTASVPGMLTGVLLCLLTIVLGGLGWFVVLVAFYGIGGLSTKYRYETKRRRGVAEANEGARGSGNVLGNSAVALAAVVGYAASPALALPGTLFLFAFTGSLAAAMADTLSSELGGLFDEPRLITTLETVEPGTDGGVTWQGSVAGLVGSVLVAGIAVALLPLPALAGSVAVAGVVVAVGGMVGMTVDSILGATLEGHRIENVTVNLLATLAGALSSVLLALLL